MNPTHTVVERPRRRHPLRRRLGREYFILKRRFGWRFGPERWSETISKEELPHLWKEHRSLLLRPLRDVDMELQRNKVTNLRIAISCIDGLLIRPGETFSLWKLVGRPTERRGYLPGLMIENGRIGQGVGGGLCQLGNLLYWIALHTPLTIKERWRHSYDVFPDVNRTLPFGSGATLAYNYVDLQIFNPTDDLFRINLRLSDTDLHGEIRCSHSREHDYEVFETDHAFRHQWWGGYTRHNRIWRRVTNRETGQERVELVTENHAIMMYEPMLPAGEGRSDGEV